MKKLSTNQRKLQYLEGQGNMFYANEKAVFNVLQAVFAIMSALLFLAMLILMVFSNKQIMEEDVNMCLSLILVLLSEVMMLIILNSTENGTIESFVFYDPVKKAVVKIVLFIITTAGQIMLFFGNLRVNPFGFMNYVKSQSAGMVLLIVGGLIIILSGIHFCFIKGIAAVITKVRKIVFLKRAEKNKKLIGFER